MYVIRHYLTASGRDPFQEWFERLRDRQGQLLILRRLSRAGFGILGDHKFCRNGVSELRVDFGPGYRIYFGKHEGQVLILLCAGDKGSQPADISRAVVYWQDWQQRFVP